MAKEEGGITDTIRIYEDELKWNTKEQIYEVVKLRCEMAQHSINDLVDIWYKTKGKKDV